MQVMKKMATGIRLFTYSLERRWSGAPADHIQTPSPCCLLFSELSSSLPVCCLHLTFRPSRAALLVTVRLTDCLCGCKMCWPTRLMWHSLCRCAAHFKDLTVLLLLLLFPCASVHVAGCRLFPLWALLHWSWYVKAGALGHTLVYHPACKCRNKKSFFVQTPASRFRVHSPPKSNNKWHWILGVHMWLSTSPWWTQYIFEWEATPLTLYFSYSVKWASECFTPITL